MKRKRRILITAGGTGGHIYPAQALAQQLVKLSERSEILFAAGGLSANRYFDRSRFAYREVSCAPLITKNPFTLIKNGGVIIKGIWQGLQIIRQFRPHVVVGFGSYYTIPILIAAALSRVPFVLHEANSIPGKANQWFAPYAAYVGVHFPFTASLLKGEAVEVGMPLREGYASSSIDKAAALDYFGLPKGQTLLIFGGSQGAQGINQLISQALPLLQGMPLQFIHLTGSDEEADRMRACYAQYQLPVVIKPFEKNMQLAWKAADLFVGRSGASSIGEAMEFEVPGILIPYPHAAENHQDKNADFFVENVGGGIKLVQKSLEGKRLAEELKTFCLGDSVDRKRQAIRSYKKRPRLDLCQLVLKAIK